MCKTLSRDELLEILPSWYHAWNTHDIDSVMDLFHDDIVFVNWTGILTVGKKMLKKAWSSWFANNGQFHFQEDDTFVDEISQKVLFRWTLEWPSSVKHVEGRETRSGVDILHFYDGKIIKKLTYTRTDIIIHGQKYIMNV